MEEEPRGHQQEAALGRDQRPDLVCAGRVVHEEKSTPAVEGGPVKRRDLGFALRQAGVGMERPDHVRHGLGRGQGVGAGALEIEIDLGVGVERRKLPGERESERGLADAAHAADSGNGHVAARRHLPQLSELGCAAGEVGGWGRELVERAQDGRGFRDPLQWRRRCAVTEEVQDVFGDLLQLGISLRPGE